MEIVVNAEVTPELIKSDDLNQGDSVHEEEEEIQDQSKGEQNMEVDNSWGEEEANQTPQEKQ